MGGGRARAARRLDHHDVAPRARGATDPPEDLGSAPAPTTPAGTPHHIDTLGQGLPEYLGHGQDDRPVDDALRQHLVALAAPGVDRDLGPAHRDAMLAPAPVETAVCDSAYLLGSPAPAHLVHEAILVARLVARVDVCEPVPGLSTALCEDVPGLGWCGKQQGAPSAGRGGAVRLL